jgi:hypothetical protein
VKIETCTILTIFIRITSARQMEVETKQENLSKSEKVKYFKDRKEASKRAREELVNLNSNVDKFSANAMHTLKYQKESLKVNGWCENCWLIKSHCLCDKLNQLNLSLSFEGENNEIDYHIWLYMHAKEYGRSTNTGTISNPSSFFFLLFTN